MSAQEKTLLLASSDVTSRLGGDKSVSEDIASTGELACDEQASEGNSLWTGTDLRQKILLVYVMTFDFLSLFCTSVPSPFLARMVAKRRGTVLQSAVILQGVMLAMALSCILCAKFQPKLGCKILFILGLGLFSSCQMALGFLQFTNDLTTFVTVGTVLRILQGIAEGAFAVSSTTLLCQEYPNHLATVFGITEAAVGAGYLMGPVVGGVLFDLSGMLLPMAVSGGVVLVCLPMSFFLLKEYSDGDSPNNNFSLIDWILSPTVVLVLSAVATVFGAVGYCDTVITSYVETLGFSVTRAGLVLFCMGISYCVASIGAGCLADLNSWVRNGAIALGFCGFTFIVLIFTPHQSRALVYIGASLFGIFVSFATVPAFQILVKSSDEENMNEAEKFSLQSTVSGAWYFSIGIGMFVLSLTGSALNDSLGSFYLSLFSTVSAGLLFTAVLFCTMLVVKRFRAKK